MATTKDFKSFAGEPLSGTVVSDTGSTYNINTDANTVVSCSCISWINDSKMKKGEKRAIKDRWCKHLEGIRDGKLKLIPNGATKIIERVVIQKVAGSDPLAAVRAELEAAEHAVAQAKKEESPEALLIAMNKFKVAREKCLSTDERLAREAEDAKERLAKLTDSMGSII